MKNPELSYPLLLEVINRFYDLAKTDVMIGYHFRFIDDFESHIPRIADFWYLQLTGKLNDKQHLPFKLLEVHRGLGIKKGEMGRWRTLFEQNLTTFEKSGSISASGASEFKEKMNHFFSKIENYLFP